MLRRGKQLVLPATPLVVLSDDDSHSKSVALPNNEDLNEELFMALRKREWTIAEIQSPEGSPNVKLTQFPPLLSAMKHVKIIRAIDQELHVLHEGFCIIATLQVLDLSRNIIARVSPRIGNLANLQVLRLQGNHIPALPETLSQLYGLTELLLSSNKLSSLPPLNSLGRLVKLDISDNKLTTLCADDSDICVLPPGIEYLDLSGNQLTTLPSSIDVLSAITHLSVANNPLTNITPVSSLVTLVSLDAHDTKLDHIAPVVCEELSQLVTLDLQGTEISELPIEFYFLSELRNFKVANIEFSRDHGVQVRGSLEAFCTFTRQTMHALFGRGLLQLIQPADFNGIDLVKGGATALILDLIKHSDSQLRRIGLEVLSAMIKFEHSKAELLRCGVIGALLSVLKRQGSSDDADGNAGSPEQTAHARMELRPPQRPSHSQSVVTDLPEREAIRGNERRLAAACFDLLARNSTNMNRIAIAAPPSNGIHLLMSLAGDEDAVVAALISQALASLGAKLPLTGYLHVRAMEATDLCVDPRSPSSPARPYVHFQVDEAEFSTDCATDRSLPGWPENRFTAALFQPVGRTLTVSVFDHRKLYWDTPIGTATVPLSELMDAQLHDRWVVLQHPASRTGSDTGRVARLHLSLQFVPHQSEELDTQAAKAHAWLSPYKTQPPCPPPISVSTSDLPCIAAATAAADVVDAVTTPSERIAHSLPILAASLPDYGSRGFVEDVLLSLDCSNAVYYDEADCLVYPNELVKHQWSNRHSPQRTFFAERPATSTQSRCVYMSFMGILDPAKLLQGLYHMKSMFDVGRAHAGLLELAESVSLLPIVSILRAPGYPARIVLTGHSAGGAVALLVFLRLAVGGILTRAEVQRVRVITFGRPLCIDQALADFVEEHALAGNIHSFVNYGDLAASLLATSATDLNAKYFDQAKAAATETLDSFQQGASTSPPPPSNQVEIVDIDAGSSTMTTGTSGEAGGSESASPEPKPPKPPAGASEDDGNARNADDNGLRSKAASLAEQASDMIQGVVGTLENAEDIANAVEDRLQDAVTEGLAAVSIIDVDDEQVASVAGQARKLAHEKAKQKANQHFKHGRLGLVTSVLGLMQSHLKETAGQVETGSLGARGAARLQELLTATTAENTLQPLVEKLSKQLSGGELPNMSAIGRYHIISDSESPVISSLRKDKVIMDYLRTSEPFSSDNFTAHSLTSYFERIELLKGSGEDEDLSPLAQVPALSHMKSRCGSTALRELGVYKPTRRMSIASKEDIPAMAAGEGAEDEKGPAPDPSFPPAKSAIPVTPSRKGASAATATNTPGGSGSGNEGDPSVPNAGLNLEPFRPEVNKSSIRFDQGTSTLDISLLGKMLKHVTRLKFRGSLTLHEPIYQTDDEIRFRLKQLPRTGGTLDYCVIRVTSPYGEARQRLNLAAYESKMQMEPTLTCEAATAVAERSNILDRDDPPAMVFTVSQGAFKNLLAAAFNVLNHRYIADVLLKTYLFSDYFQEQLAEAGDLEMVVSLVELQEVNVPPPRVVLNPRTKQVTVVLSNVRIQCLLAFRLIRFTDYIVYRDCGAELTVKNLSGKFVFDVSGGVVRPATTTASAPGTSPSTPPRKPRPGTPSTPGGTPAGETTEQPACSFDIDIETLDLKLGLDIERGGIQYANKANWGYAGVIISRMSKRLKQLLVWLLSGRDFTQFLSAELMAAMVRDKPDEFQLDETRTFLVDYSLTRPPDIVRSDALAFFQTAHRASVGLEGQEESKELSSVPPPGELLTPEILTLTEDAHATVVVSPHFFNSALASLYLAKAFNVTLRVTHLPAAIQALLTPKLISQLSLPAILGMGIRIEVLQAPRIIFGDNTLKLECHTACHIVGEDDAEAVMSKEVPILAEISMENFAFTSEGLQSIGSMVMGENGVAALRASLGQYGDEITEFIKVLYEQVVTPMFSRLISMTSRTRLPHLGDVAGAAQPKATCTPDALILSIHIPTFEFSHDQLEKFSQYLIAKINPQSTQTLQDDVVESTFDWMEGHLPAGGASAAVAPTAAVLDEDLD